MTENEKLELMSLRISNLYMHKQIAELKLRNENLEKRLNSSLVLKSMAEHELARTRNYMSSLGINWWEDGCK